MRTVATSKLDKIVETIYSRIDDGMVPSEITSPDTTICVLSGELVFVDVMVVIVHVYKKLLRKVQITY